MNKAILFFIALFGAATCAAFAFGASSGIAAFVFVAFLVLVFG